MFRDQGELIALGLASTKGIVEITDHDGAQGEGPRALVRICAVTLATGSLVGLAVGSALVVRGLNWKVSELAFIEDGWVTELRLASA